MKNTIGSLLSGLMKNHIFLGRANVVIILGGMYVAYSEWIDYEIDEAVRMGKPIIGVRPWGQERMPQKIQDVANKIVGWNRESIIQAVRDLT